MKLIYIVLGVLVLTIASGCNKSSSVAYEPADVQVQEPCLYVAERAHIIGLTSIGLDPDNRSSSVLSAYVSLEDQFDSSVKAPAVFRFELYEYVPRSSQPKGKRLYLSPEFDLSDAVVNNEYWKDFLRTYNFSLDVNINSSPSRIFILQVTCVTPAGKRLTDFIELESVNN